MSKSTCSKFNSHHSLSLIYLLQVHEQVLVWFLAFSVAEHHLRAVELLPLVDRRVDNLGEEGSTVDI